MGSDFDTTLTVYSGVALDALVSVASNDDDAGSRASRVVFRAAAGISYQIAVDSFGDSTGNISLGLTATPVSQSPPGDFFASPVVISGTSWDLTADNTGATLEFEEPPHDGRLGGASLWWSWMAAESGPVILDTQGSLIDTVLAVYLGDHISSLTAVTANDDSEGGVWSRVNFVAVAGTVYRIAVDGYSGATGPLALHLRQTPMQRAVNDAFADRISISGSPVTVSGTNVGATGEPGEPIHHPSTGGRSVWWSWTALQEGFVDIQTTGSGFDTVLAVYVGDSLPTLDLVGSDDDGGGGQGASRLRFFATAGTTYQIAVDGFSAATGFVQLSLHQQPSDAPPPNDAFANRILLAGEVPLGTARNSGASAELGEPRHAGNEARRSAWWTWTSPRNELVSVTTEGSTFDTVLGVYTGGALADLIRVAANDDTKPGNPASVTTFPAIAGVSYQLVVDSFTGGLPPGSESVGDIVLRVLSFAEAADSSGIAWSLPSLGASWYAQPRTSHEGNGALESPPLLDGESAEVATTVNGPGRLQFWWSVSSEESYDFLRFRINGVELSAISGRTTWTQSIFDLPAGPQVLTWAYQKDASRSEGLDSAWLDGVRFTPAGEVPEIVLHPAGGRLAPGTSHTLVVQVSGPGPFTYLWRKDGTPVPGGNSQSLLLAALEPGLVGDYTVEVTNPFGSVQSNPAHVALLATRGVLVYPVTIAGDSGPWRFEATTEIGRDYRVQYSEDLQDWTDLVQWTSREQVFGFDDSAIRATGVRYFRVVSP